MQKKSNWTRIVAVVLAALMLLGVFGAGLSALLR